VRALQPAPPGSASITARYEDRQPRVSGGYVAETPCCGTPALGHDAHHEFGGRARRGPTGL